jgi:hypothetical protein
MRGGVIRREARRGDATRTAELTNAPRRVNVRHAPCCQRLIVELIAVMLLLLAIALATLPMWPYSTRWTYYPAGTCALVVAVIVYLTLDGRL